MIEVRGHKLPNSPDEMTVGKFEKLQKILISKVKNMDEPDGEFEFEGEIEKWSAVLVYMGLSEEVINDMELDEFKAVVKDFNTQKKITFEPVKEFTIGTRTFRAYKDEFKITIPKWKRLQAMANRSPLTIVSEIMAIMFEDTQLTEAEHKAPAHIKKKAATFRKELSAGVAVPYVAYITQKLLEDKQLAIDAMKAIHEAESSGKLEPNNG